MYRNFEYFNKIKVVEVKNIQKKVNNEKAAKFTV